MTDRVKQLLEDLTPTSEESRLLSPKIQSVNDKPALVQLYAADLIASGLLAISKSIDEFDDDGHIAKGLFAISQSLDGLTEELMVHRPAHSRRRG